MSEHLAINRITQVIYSMVCAPVNFLVIFTWVTAIKFYAQTFSRVEDPLNKCADIKRNVPFSLCIYNSIVCHHHRHNFRHKVQICISVQVCGILDPPFQVKVNPSAIFQVENYFLLNYQQNRKPLTRLATHPISDPISWSSGAVTGNIIDLSQTRPLLVAIYHKISILLEVFWSL